jgi:hypothetical protein
LGFSYASTAFVKRNNKDMRASFSWKSTPFTKGKLGLLLNMLLLIKGNNRDMVTGLLLEIYTAHTQ